MTEKFFDPFISGTVPVYHGAPNVELFAPGPNSFIDASKLSGPKELAEYLIHLDNDDDAYRRYFCWRDAGLSAGLEKLLSKCEEEPFRRLCTIVVERLSTYRPPTWVRSMFAPRIPLVH